MRRKHKSKPDVSRFSQTRSLLTTRLRTTTRARKLANSYGHEKENTGYFCAKTDEKLIGGLPISPAPHPFTNFYASTSMKFRLPLGLRENNTGLLSKTSWLKQLLKLLFSPHKLLHPDKQCTSRELFLAS